MFSSGTLFECLAKCSNKRSSGPWSWTKQYMKHNNVCQLWAEVPGFTLWTASADVQQIKVLFVVVMAGNVLHHVGRHEHITITTGRELYTPLN